MTLRIDLEQLHGHRTLEQVMADEGMAQRVSDLLRELVKGLNDGTTV
jgi:hypothetical protein